MGRLVAPARPVRTPTSDRRRIASELGRVERKQPPRVVPIPFVQVKPYAVVTWPAGTAWLDTSVVGPLGSHPLRVKLPDGAWTVVALLVPVA